MADAPRVAELAGDKCVSNWTANIPFPYTEQDALNWITRVSSTRVSNRFAILYHGQLAGCVSHWKCGYEQIEVGYWVSRPFWRRGIATAAPSKVLAIEDQDKARGVVARTMVGNAASQRVLQRCGFVFSRHTVLLKEGRRLEALRFLRGAREDRRERNA